MSNKLVVLSVLALVATALAGGPSDVSFDCTKAKAACDANQYYTADRCESIYEACEGCVTQELSLKQTDPNPGNNEAINGTEDIQNCYFKALNSDGTSLFVDDSSSQYAAQYYTCADFFNTCSTWPDANHAFCASQESACDSCAEQFAACDSVPDPNSGYCADTVQACVYKNVFDNNERPNN